MRGQDSVRILAPDTTVVVNDMPQRRALGGAIRRDEGNVTALTASAPRGRHIGPGAGPTGTVPPHAEKDRATSATCFRKKKREREEHLCLPFRSLPACPPAPVSISLYSTIPSLSLDAAALPALSLSRRRHILSPLLWLPALTQSIIPSPSLRLFPTPPPLTSLPFPPPPPPAAAAAPAAASSLARGGGIRSGCYAARRLSFVSPARAGGGLLGRRRSGGLCYGAPRAGGAPDAAGSRGRRPGPGVIRRDSAGDAGSRCFLGGGARGISGGGSAAPRRERRAGRRSSERAVKVIRSRSGFPREASAECAGAEAPRRLKKAWSKAMGLAPPELGQFDGWESSGEEERERWGWCRRSRRRSSSSSRRRASTKGAADDDTTVATGCCIRLWPVGSCPPPPPTRSKVDTSTSSASTHGAEKSTENGSKNQPAALVVSGSTTTSNAESSSSASKVGEEIKVASQLRKFAFNDLKCATRNFRPESLLGEGGFGCVFKGWIEENGTAPVKPGTGLTVAVKTLNHDGLQGHKEWVAEVDFLGNLHHPNLVRLIGYCVEDDQRLLVYEFMPRGSLDNHLFRRSLPLPWAVRMKVALGAAKGLAFLHEEAERPVIYRDFKTSNILLDAEYNAKLSDFGLAKDGPVGDKTHVSTRVMGTYGYAAPEYVMTGHLTSKSDVYSFGVVLLEMMSGRRSMDKNRPNGEHNLVEWARPLLGERQRFYKLIDPRLEGNFSVKGAQKAAQLARACLSRDPKARPLMSQVVEVLKPLLNLKDMASSSYFYQTMQAERMAHSSSMNGRSFKSQGPFAARNGQQPVRSLSDGPRASPFRYSPKPNMK